MALLDKNAEEYMEAIVNLPTMLVDSTKTAIIDGHPMVWFICPNCQNGRWIRKVLAAPKYKKSSFCKDCAWIAQIKWATPGEFDSNPNIIVDYTRQKVSVVGNRLKRVVYIWSICPDCKEERWLLSNWLRNQGRTSLCMPCARKRIGFLGERSSNWNGGIQISKIGYRMIHELLLPRDQVPFIKEHLNSHRGYYYEHRVVALLTYGPAAVAPKMVVRHLDGDKLNNQPSNLAFGPQSANIRDHVEDRRDMKKWRRLAEKLAKENALLKQIHLQI